MMNPSELLLTSSVLILAVLALRHFGRGRLSRRLCYGLWLVVLLRLLVPVSLPSPTSVLNLPAAQSAERFLAQRVEVITPDGAASARPETAEPAAPEETAPAAETLPQFSPLVLIWAAGALGTSGWFLWVNARFARQLRRAGGNSRFPRVRCRCGWRRGSVPPACSDCCVRRCISPPRRRQTRCAGGMCSPMSSVTGGRRITSGRQPDPSA